MNFKGLLSILNIAFCLIIGLNSYGQIGRTETKKGVIYNYYAESDNLHSKGKKDDNGMQGKWSYYTDAPADQQSEYQYFTYMNDTLNGPFLKFGDDKRISGIYLNGHYHGMIVIEEVVISGTDTTYLPLEEGSYTNGMKSSFFKEFKKGKLESEGGFDQDKKNGSWKFYDISGSEPVLQKKTYYKRDIKDGKEITYFEYDDDGNKVDKRSEYFYKDDIKNGPFEIKLNGKTIEKGNYTDGKLSGEHQIFIKEKDLMRYGNYYEGNLTGPVAFKDASGAEKISGSYDNGKKSSTWKYYDKAGKLEKEENYKDDQPQGSWKYYEGDKVIREIKFEDHSAKEIIEYKKGSTEPLAEFYLNDVTGTYQEVEALLYYKDSSKTINVLISVDLLKDPSNLHDNFKKNLNNPELIKKNGMYEFYLKGKKLIEGYYEMDKMAGKWNYFYSSDVIWEKTYAANQLTGEKFLEAGVKAPFKGTYEVSWSNGNPRFEFKIKDGLRNGKSVYYLENGEEERSEKFKEGVKN